MAKTKLKDPDITNVDLVDRPANPGARIMLFKRDSDPDPGAADSQAGKGETKKTGLLHLIAKKLGLTDQDLEEVEKDETGAETFDEAFTERTARRVLEDLWDYTSALQESVCSILKDSAVTDKLGMIGGSLDQFHAAVLSAVPMWLRGRSVMKAEEAVSADTLVRLKKTVQSLQAIITEGEAPKGDGERMAGEFNKTSLPKDAQDYVTKLEGEIAELKKNATPPPGGTPKPEDVLKALDPAVKKMFDDMEARTKAAEDVAKRALDESTTRTFVAKAAGYANLGIKADEFGQVLKSISEKCPEAIEKLDAVLKAANEAVSKGNLFGENGSTRSGGSGGTGGVASWNKIQEGARNMVAKAGTPMSDEQAVAKFLETTEGKALYTEYLKERSGK